MQFFTAFLFAAVASAQCFDDFDCFFSGGHCSKSAGGLLGACQSSAPATASTVSTAPVATPTSGRVCFDDGDCFSFPTFGKCVHSANSFLGYCADPAPSGTAAKAKVAREFAA